MVISGTKPFGYAAALLILAAIAGLPGCKQEAGSAPAQEVSQVEVVTVTRQTIPDEPEFIGVVRDGDAVTMPKGFHPNVSVPGHPINFVWLMAAHREVEGEIRRDQHGKAKRVERQRCQ